MARAAWFAVAVLALVPRPADAAPAAPTLPTFTREIAPWGADPHYGKFKDDRSLTAEQIETIAKWVDAGAPKGSDADLPRMPTFASGWSHGQPDVVIEMPVDFDVPAEGEVPV